MKGNTYSIDMAGSDKSKNFLVVSDFHFRAIMAPIA